MNVPVGKQPLQFIDLEAQQTRIRDRIDAAIARVLDHGQYIMGPEVFELERTLSAFCGDELHTITCANGTDALVLALMAKELRPGDCVIIPSFTYCATAEAVCLAGGVPFFADVSEDTYNLAPDSLKAAITAAKELNLKVRGVITVDLFGQPCDYDAVEPIVRENGVFLICDAAQAFGATYEGKPIGSIGDLTTTSFFPGKPLGCYGDGGAVLTNDEELAAACRSLRVHGQGIDKYDNVRVGMNSRLDTLQAAILLEKLRVYPEEIAARNLAAGRYQTALRGHVKVPELLPEATSVWAQYTIRHIDRTVIAAALADHGIPHAVYYRLPLHMQPAYRRFYPIGFDLSISERLARTVLSLPFHPYLAPEVQDHIAEVVADATGHQHAFCT